MKTWIKWSLILFVLVSLGYVIAAEFKLTESPETANSPNKSASATDADEKTEIQTIAYYFHATARCSSCLKIENYTTNAIHTNFKKELASGDLVWRLVNIDEEPNKGYISKYRLHTKSVVLVRQQGKDEGEWKNLRKVWQLLNDEQGFTDYITKEVRDYLEKG